MLLVAVVKEQVVVEILVVAYSVVVEGMALEAVKAVEEVVKAREVVVMSVM